MVGDGARGGGRVKMCCGQNWLVRGWGRLRAAGVGAAWKFPWPVETQWKSGFEPLLKVDITADRWIFAASLRPLWKFPCCFHAVSMRVLRLGLGHCCRKGRLTTFMKTAFAGKLSYLKVFAGKNVFRPELINSQRDLISFRADQSYSIS